MLHEQEGYAIETACRLLALPHSTYYYRPGRHDERGLETAIEDIAGRFPTYGTRRITHQLGREPVAWRVNRKHVRRIMAQKGLLRRVRRRRVRTTDSQHGYPGCVSSLNLSPPG